MPYVTKTREVRRTLLQRLFTRPWLKKWKTVEYQSWVPPVTLLPRLQPVPIPQRPAIEDSAGQRILLESASADDFVSHVIGAILMEDTLS